MTAKISVVVPAYNEEKLLERCLQGVREQSFVDYELIVVDNASVDGTHEIADHYADKVIYEPAQGCAIARQTGFAASSSGIIASTDADTIVPRDWLQRIWTHFAESSDVIGVYGPFKFHDGTKLQNWWADRAITNFMRLNHALGFPQFIGSNFAVRRQPFESIGGFRTNVEVSSDLDLSLRLRTVGKIILDSNLVVLTSARAASTGSISLLLYWLRNYIGLMFLGHASARRPDIR